MTTTHPAARDVPALGAGVVVGNDGSEVGHVGQVDTDNDTGQPSWVTVKTGWFGSNESFVPLNSATIAGRDHPGALFQGHDRGAPTTPPASRRAGPTSSGSTPMTTSRRPVGGPPVPR